MFYNNVSAFFYKLDSAKEVPGCCFVNMMLRASQLIFSMVILSYVEYFANEVPDQRNKQNNYKFRMKYLVAKKVSFYLHN